MGMYLPMRFATVGARSPTEEIVDLIPSPTESISSDVLSFIVSAESVVHN